MSGAAQSRSNSLNFTNRPKKTAKTTNNNTNAKWIRISLSVFAAWCLLGILDFQAPPSLSFDLDAFLSEPRPDIGSIESIIQVCRPTTAQDKAKLEHEIEQYEASRKFEHKINALKGNQEVHQNTMNFITSNILKEGTSLKEGVSVLDLGAAAGALLRQLADTYNGIGVKRGHFQGVELVPGWVRHARQYFAEDKTRFYDISFVRGDITDFKLDHDRTFDLVVLTDVMEHLQRNRYGCFFQRLREVTHENSVVYMHTPTPEAQLAVEDQYYENILPHHILIAGMAKAGFQLVQFEHDVGFKCKTRKARDGSWEKVPKDKPNLIRGSKCVTNGWPKYYRVVFVRSGDKALYELH